MTISVPVVHNSNNFLTCLIPVGQPRASQILSAAHTTMICAILKQKRKSEVPTFLIRLNRKAFSPTQVGTCNISSIFDTIGDKNSSANHSNLQVTRIEATFSSPLCFDVVLVYVYLLEKQRVLFISNSQTNKTVWQNCLFLYRHSLRTLSFYRFCGWIFFCGIQVR